MTTFVKDRKRTVFLFLTDNCSNEILDVFAYLERSIMPPDTACLLFHQKDSTLSSRMQELNSYLFTYDSLLKLNYTPVVMDIIPGSNHFPVLQFFLDFPDYDYYWVIEDDVRFTGDWKYLFDFFAAYEHDFITGYLRTFSRQPEWRWWNLVHPQFTIPLEDRIGSFNPIYRISKKALEYIHYALTIKWVGHHEVLLPTLLYHNGYKILDFGGKGQFVPAENVNRFYISTEVDNNGNFIHGSLRHRPIWETAGNLANKIYHPVKISYPFSPAAGAPLTDN